MAGSRNPDTAKAYAQDNQIPEWGSYEDVLNNPDIDCVYISTPPTLHEEWVIKAAQHNKHVLCEKPAVTSFDAAKRCINACQENGVKFFEGYVYKFHPQHQFIKEKFSQLGQPFKFNSHYAVPAPKEGNIRYDTSLKGGVFYDALGYGISAMLYYFDASPESVLAQAYHHPEHGVDQAVSLTLRYPSLPLVQIFAGFGVQYRSRYELHCENGIITPKRAYAINEDVSPQIEIDTADGVETVSLDPANQFLEMVNGFCEYVYTGKETYLINQDHMLKQHHIMQKAWESLEAKKVVEI